MAGRRQAISVVGSLLVHASFALYLLQPVRSSILSAPPRGADDGATNAVAVSLVNAKAVSATATAAAPAPVEQPLATRPSPTSAAWSASLPTSSMTPAPASRSEPAQAAAGSAASAGTAGAAPADPELGLDYQRRLLAHIEPYKRYPEAAANESRPRGVVQLVFQIDRAGRVLGVWIAHSSGFAALDTAAIDTVRRAAPLPAIPAGLPDSMAVQLPVEFSAPG
jgi:periplasmic protein TonB